MQTGGKSRAYGQDGGEIRRAQVDSRYGEGRRFRWRSAGDAATGLWSRRLFGGANLVRSSWWLRLDEKQGAWRGSYADEDSKNSGGCVLRSGETMAAPLVHQDGGSEIGGRKRANGANPVSNGKTDLVDHSMKGAGQLRAAARTVVGIGGCLNFRLCTG